MVSIQREAISLAPFIDMKLRFWISICLIKDWNVDGYVLECFLRRSHQWRLEVEVGVNSQAKQS